MCSRDQFSETQDNFRAPKLKHPSHTRSRFFEQFLWKELYDEYVRYNDRLLAEKIEQPNSEYIDKYSKEMPPEDQEKKAALIGRYPLYCTRAITLWNHDGDITKDFKRRYSITRPVNEQREQFG